jgi:hypothetical protein
MTRPEQPSRTIRELGGELWAELSSMPPTQLHWKVRDIVVDIIMGVLARHSGSIMENDRDLPVTPRPQARVPGAAEPPAARTSDLAYQVTIADSVLEPARVEVSVRFETGAVHDATFTTPDAIREAMRQRTAGDFAAGPHYTWSSHLVVVDNLDRAAIEQVIAHLIATRNFESAFHGPPTRP